jgi:hypothetical protein
VSRRRAAALAALLWCLAVWPAPAPALVPVLSDRDIAAAIEAGDKAIAQENFDEEWRLPPGDCAEIEVTTPFYRVAAAARQAAFKNEPLADKDRQEAIDRGKGRIQLKATMHGKAVDFARWYDPVLVAGRQEIKASFVQNERTALKQEEGRFAARNIYVFPVEGLPAQGTVTLVVRHRIDKKEVCRASIDLSKMR